MSRTVGGKVASPSCSKTGRSSRREVMRGKKVLRHSRHQWRPAVDPGQVMQEIC